MSAATSQVFNTANLEKLSGIVARITFHSPETGWTILKVAPFDRPGDEVAVIVHQSKVFAGATMAFYGNWAQHPKFGEQFKAVKVEELKPASANALEKYLGSGLIKGVGPAFAKRIVKHFGKDTLEVFDTDIDRLMEVPGIAQKKLKTIVNAWEEHKDIKDVMLFLQSYDISTLFAVKIYKTYSKDAIKVVSENPYRLAKDIYGIGFFSADKVALSMGLSTDSEQRISAAIEHVLAASREEGHCYLTTAQIVKQVNELLENKLDDRVQPLLDTMEQAGDVKTRQLVPPQVTKSETPTVDTAVLKATCYYAPSIYYDEDYIAKKVKQLADNHTSVDTKRMDAWIAKYREKYGISLSDEQQQAVTSIAGCGLSILTGGPGCGKTTTTRVIVGLLNAMGKKVVLGAPTGRASQRMTEVIGLQAKTLHRLLEWQPAQGGFKKNEQEPLKADVLIIDECSMLDVHLAAAALRAVSLGTQVLFIGDADQLPPVGAGNVFKDIIASDTVPVFRLTKIFRQAQESSIIRFAHEINKGVTPKVESPFHIPSIWKQGMDCLFIDADEATQEQLKFIKRVKANPKDVFLGQDVEEVLSVDDALDTPEPSFIIPDKFRHVDIEQLIKTDTGAEELREVLKNVHPWSSLRYGLTATDMVRRLYSKTIPQYFGEGIEIQVLSPMTKGSLGTFSLNKLLQEELNPSGQGKAQLLIGERLFRVGDRVIQKRNNYDLEVFNGDIGTVIDAYSEDMKLVIAYKSNGETREVTYEKDTLNEIELAYAITIHKSQGSEFGAVIIPITTQHFNLLFRNLIYTGLTRAKKLAVFVGSRRALAMAVNNNKMLIRQTGLEELLHDND
jgi:exodeoxyribonuclease V alpha subunit